MSMAMKRNASQPPTELEYLGEISAKLDTVIGLLAMAGKDRDQKIVILSSLGFNARKIGVLVGMSTEAVKKHNQRKRKSR